MIKLAYCNVNNLDLNKAYKLLPDFRKTKVNNFRFERDKKLSAGAYLLLSRMLLEIGIEKPSFKHEKFGKAYISNFSDVYFNLSHSNKMIACAISDCEVGVDVEYIDSTIDLNIAKNYFYNEEYEKIMTSPDCADEFFKYWVLKESYMKYTGLGFQLKLDEFTINIGDEIKLKGNDELKFSLFNLNHYKLGVCSECEVGKALEYDVSQIVI